MVKLVVIILVASIWFQDIRTIFGLTLPGKVPVLEPMVLSELVMLCWVKIIGSVS